MHLPRNFLTESDRWHDLPADQLTFLTTGSQGEPLSVLHRVALDDHKTIKIEPGDTVILSSKFIPGNEKTISNMINHLYRRGAEVHYEKVSEIHVSGHASQEELKTMLQLTRPRYFVPIHGEYRHLVRHRRLGSRGRHPGRELLYSGGRRCLGDLTAHSAQKTNPIQVGKVFVDGRGVGDVGDVVIRDRRHLSEDGMVLVVMAIHQQSGELVAGPDLISRGFMRAEESEEVLETGQKGGARNFGGHATGKLAPIRRSLKEEVRKALRRFFRKKLGAPPGCAPLHHRNLRLSAMSSAPEKGRLHREIWGVVICLTCFADHPQLDLLQPADRSLNTPSGAINTHNWGGFIGAFLGRSVVTKPRHDRLSDAGFSMHGSYPNVSRQLSQASSSPRAVGLRRFALEHRGAF